MGKTKKGSVCCLLVLASASRSLPIRRISSIFHGNIPHYVSVLDSIAVRIFTDIKATEQCIRQVVQLVCVICYKCSDFYIFKITLTQLAVSYRLKSRYWISHTLSAPSRPQRISGVTNCCRIIHAESALKLKPLSHSVYDRRMRNVRSVYTHGSLTVRQNILCLNSSVPP